jgi:hypothetical protein
MMKKLTFLIMLILSYNLLAAQSTQIIKGKIVDGKGLPLVGATVYLTVEGKAAAADAKGDFSIASNNPENKLRVTFIGYKMHELAPNRHE